MLSERFEKAVSFQKAGKNEEALRGFEAISNEMSDEYDKSRVLLYEVACLVSLGRLKEPDNAGPQQLTILRIHIPIS
jgi:hypothetical protein